MPSGDSLDDVDWAWFADAYRQVPEPRPEAIAHAVHAVQASATAWHIARIATRWFLGTATGIGVVVGGHSLVKSGRARSADARSNPVDTAAPPRTSAPTTKSPSAVAPPPSVVPPRAVAPSTAPAPSPAPEATTESGPPDTRADTIMIPEPAPEPLDSVTLPGLSETDLKRFRAALGEPGLHDLSMVVHDAIEAGLPPLSLLERAMEGVVNGASPSAIMEAVKHRLEVLHDAQRVFGTGANEDQLIAGVYLLESGVAASELAGVRQRTLLRGRTAAGMHALISLVVAGVPGPEAAAAILRHLDTGASDATILALRNQVSADIAHGVPPLDALRARFGNVARDSMAPAPAPMPEP